MGEEFYRLNSKRLENKKIHHCEVDASDYKRVNPKIELLKRLSEIEFSIYAVYDMNKCNYLMKSDEQKKLFGCDELYNIDSEDHYKSIHPNDLAFVLETDNLIFKFFSETPPEEKKSYKLIYDFRSKNTKGVYVRYRHQVVVLEQDKNGRSWLMLIITDVLPNKVAREQPQRRIIHIKTGEIRLFEDNTSLNSRTKLTNREIEIIGLISKGYDSHEIAEKLYISINTVNNHRQNIIRKTKAVNTTQAILYCKRLGVI